MTLTSTSLKLPEQVEAVVDATGVVLDGRRFEIETSALGRDRHWVKIREGDRVRYSGRARSVCADDGTVTDPLSDIRSRLILGLAWFQLRDRIESSASRRAITDQLSARSSAIKMCWERSLQTDGPTNATKVEVTLHLGADRAVKRVELGGPAARRGRLSKCLQKELRAWRFPPGVAPKARFPLILHLAGY